LNFPTSGREGPKVTKGAKGRYNPSLVSQIFNIQAKGKAPGGLSKEFNIRPIYFGKEAKSNIGKPQPFKPFKLQNFGKQTKK
jgi:hypothetical protein